MIATPFVVLNQTCKCSPNFNVLVLLGILVLTASMVCMVSTAVPLSATSTFTIYGLNVNGMVQPVKVNHFNTIIGARWPHIFIVNKTKTKSKLSSSLPFSDYDIYEEPGECAEGHHIFKGGSLLVFIKIFKLLSGLRLSREP